MKFTEGTEAKVGVASDPDNLIIQNLKKINPLVCFLISSLFAVAQNIDLEGTIKDENGTPIMGANIVAVEKETQVLDGFGISNESGYYMLTLKKDTDYDIKISFIGLKEVSFLFI